MRLAVLTSHPVQYYAPLFRELARRMDLKVFFAHRATPNEQARAGFGTPFEWDVDLTSGYPNTFLENVARRPGIGWFSGCDTPGIGRALRQGKFDALLLMGWHLKSYLQGLLAAKRLGIPVLVRGDSQLATPRSPLKRMAKALAYPPFLRLFNTALYTGERSRTYYEHYRYPSQRLFFSPHCIDNEWFAVRATREAGRHLRERFGIARETSVLLFAGKLVPFKRPMDLLLAAALCRESGRNVEVMIAGDGELRGHLIAEAKELSVPLHMLGFCNQTEMPAAYAAADCLILPSDGRETWGLVANEALACGRRVIVSGACGCAPDLARDADAGRCFPAGDTQALAKCIQDTIETPPARAKIARISSAYSLDAAVTGITAALECLSRTAGRDGIG
jgi:glycosyltransferase involved in cell wall biosynthesis